MKIPRRSLFALSHALLLLMFLLAAFNVALLIGIHRYEFQVGPLRVVAQDLFKPLQYLNILFFVLLVLRGVVKLSPPADRSEAERNDNGPGLAQWGIALVCIAALYVPSFAINLGYFEWAHTRVSASLTSVGSVFRLFTAPAGDGFYRPMTFLSLWLDYKIFGDALWGYHIQSVVLHLINMILTFYLGVALRLGRWTSFHAAILLGAAPFASEAVMWPAARFDLLAATFVLLALIGAIRYLTNPVARQRDLFLAGVAYTLGLLNKESAYSFLAVMAAVVLLFSRWLSDRFPTPRFVRLSVVVLSITGISLVPRVLIYGNLGGYRTASGEFTNFLLGWGLPGTVLTRLFGIAPYEINHGGALPGWVLWGIGCYVLTLTAIAVFGKRSGGFHFGLVLCSLASSMPVMSILIWVGPTGQQARYLYLPGIWIALLMAVAISGTRFPRVVLAGLLVAGAIGTTFNLWVYRDVLNLIDRGVERVSADTALNPGIKHIEIIAPTPTFRGAWFMKQEMQERLNRRNPEIRTSMLESSDNNPTLDRVSTVSYCWSSTAREFLRCP